MRHDLGELEGQLEELQRRIDDAQNEADAARRCAYEAPCKENFARRRRAEAKLKALQEEKDELWQEYEEEANPWGGW